MLQSDCSLQHSSTHEMLVIVCSDDASAVSDGSDRKLIIADAGEIRKRMCSEGSQHDL